MDANPLLAFVLPHLDDANLRRVSLSGVRRGSASEIKKAVIRPVEVRGQRVLQLVTYDDRRSATANVPGPGSPAVHEVLQLPFRHVVVELTTEVHEGRVTKRGGLVTSRTRVDERPVDLAHDRHKEQPVAEDAPFLELCGISVNGRVKPSRRAKYRQINDFIRLLDGAPALERLAGEGQVRVADMGCGNGYLTFAVYHHLSETRGLDCTLVGVDRDRELIERNAERAGVLGWGGMHFEAGEIESFEPAQLPDVVIALHACDTASDHALAAVVRWESALGMVAPCCHHHVQAQLRSNAVAPAEAVLLHHGILRERLGDVLTDAARATVLRLLGYDVDVVEFVSPEHTPKNVLIRASNRVLPLRADLVAGYEELTQRWSIRPLLADLLADQLAARVTR